MSDAVVSRADQLIRTMLLEEDRPQPPRPRNAAARSQLSHPTLRRVSALLTRHGFYYSSSAMHESAGADHAFVRRDCTVVVTHDRQADTLRWSIIGEDVSRTGSSLQGMQRQLSAMAKNAPRRVVV